MGKSYIDTRATLKKAETIALLTGHDWSKSVKKYGIKRASEWAYWCILTQSIKQSIKWLSLWSMCQWCVLSLRQNALAYREAYSFRFHF